MTRRFAYPILLAAAASVALCVLVIRQLPTTTYGGASPGRLWLEGTAAVALTVSALTQTDRRRGWFLGVIGSTWLLPELAGWLSGPGPLAAIADAWSRLLAALVVVVFVPRVRARAWARALAAVALAAGGLGAASRLLLVDPLVDIRCWRRCDTNPWALADGPLGPLLDRGSALVVAGSAVACGALAILARRHGPERGIAASDVAVAAFVVGSVAPGVLRVLSTESATSAPFLSCWVVAQVGALGIAVVAVRDPLLQWRLRVRVRRLAVAFGSAPGALTDALRTALRDPALQIRYWAASRAGYVDSEGCRVDPPRPDQDTRVTYVARRGAPVAAIVHRSRIDGRRLDRVLGAALRLTLENEQLRAAALAELGALNRSRTRVVERAALERHRLERNLHDGAQQRVASLALIARMVAQRVALDHAPDTFAAGLARRAEALTSATVHELRRVARGIYPAVLADAGLAGATMELAESSSDLAVRVRGVPPERCAGIVESISYRVIETVVADARDRGAATLELCGHVAQGRLVYELVDDAAAGPGASVTDLVDQVAALSGTLDVLSCRAANRVHLELPCGL